MPPASWVFGEYPGSTPEPIHGFARLAQLYASGLARRSGRALYITDHDKFQSFVGRLTVGGS